jgi:hypothetical protein
MCVRAVFDGPFRLFKDGVLPDTDYIMRADAFHNAPGTDVEDEMCWRILMFLKGSKINFLEREPEE